MNWNTVVAYARYSSQNQREESVKTQLDAIRRYCQDNGLNLIHEYADNALTGTNDKRPQFQQMMTDAAKGLFQGVVIYCLSRFSRSVYDTLVYQDLLANHGVRLYSVIEQFEDTAEGELFAHLSMGINQYHSKQLSREVMRGLRDNASQGKFNGGRCALGYAIDPITRKLVVDEKTAPTVRMIFQRFVEGYNYRQIAKELHSLGKRTARGNPFGCLHDILRNRVYLGELVFNLRPKRNKNGSRNQRKRKSDEDIICIHGAHEPLVDEEAFSLANKLLDERRHGRKSVRRYLLSSVIKCVCGSSISGGKRYSSNGYLALSYRCNARRKPHSRCSTSDLNMEKMDAFVLSWLRDNLLTKGKESETAERINRTLALEESGKTEKLKAEAQILDESIENLIQALTTAKGGAHELIADELERLTEQRQELQQEIFAEQSQERFAQITPKNIVEAIKEYGGLLNSDDMAKRREAVLAFVAGIKADNRNLTLTVRLNPFLEGKAEATYQVVLNRDRAVGKHKNSKSYRETLQ